MPHAFNVGDYAKSIETGWVGKITAFEVDRNGDVMAKMTGVDNIVRCIIGGSLEECLTPDDVQWFDPADLLPVRLAPMAS